MNVNFRSLTKNFTYSFFANALSFVISILLIILVPKKLGLESYGYWQLYLFYSSYVGFFSFGWVDGIYLRYGGMEYGKLERKKFTSQFWIFTFIESFISFVIIVLAIVFVKDIDKSFIFIITGFACLTTAPRGMLLYIFQATNKIKEYSFVTIIEKIVSISLISIALYRGIDNYKVLLIFDISAKFISLILAIYYAKNLIFDKFESIKNIVNESNLNVKVGIKLMVANIAGMLILGVVKFGIEQNWNIETFGKISLAMSVSNMLMTFINAVGVVLFPMLKRISYDRLTEIYKVIQDVLLLFLIALIFLYYPAKIVLSAWLPKYNESLKFMVLLFPICIFESKMAMLLNTYLKALRKEREMLVINLTSVLLSIILSVIGIFVLNNLVFTVLIIVICFGFRCIISEFILSKILDIPVLKDIIIEIFVSFLFICITWNTKIYISCGIYLTMMIFVFLLKKKDLLNAKNYITTMINQ